MEKLIEYPIRKNTEIMAFDSNELSVISDLIHDHWFDLDVVKLDKPSKAVLIPCFSDRNLSDRGYTITIFNITEVVIHDTERIGIYDINKIVYDIGKSKLTVLTGIPLTFVACISSLQVACKRSINPHD